MPGQLQKRARPCFVTKSVRFRSFDVFLVPFESSRRDLESEHGFEACSLKYKGKVLDFHAFGGQTSEKKQKIKRIKLDFRASLSGYTKACGVGNLTTSSGQNTENIEKLEK